MNRRAHVLFVMLIGAAARSCTPFRQENPLALTHFSYGCAHIRIAVAFASVRKAAVSALLRPPGHRYTHARTHPRVRDGTRAHLPVKRVDHRFCVSSTLKETPNRFPTRLYQFPLPPAGWASTRYLTYLTVCSGVSLYFRQLDACVVTSHRGLNLLALDCACSSTF